MSSIDLVIDTPAPPDLARRKFLTMATTAAGFVGAAFTLVPFAASWAPSERARALGGPVTVDGARIEPGQMILVSWRRMPIFILHRTKDMVASLSGHDDRLKDASSAHSEQPPGATNPGRSIRADFWVAIGICTHLGCLPKARFTPDAPELGPQWPGGFFCPCHGSRFDLAGRVFAGSPASVNLRIPPYSIDRNDAIVIGERNT
jgi:ubiquinol-cytochrome c reductase iron-sulfur subunit